MASLLANPMYVHIACEIVVVGTVYHIMNKRISSLKKDLDECVARLGKQTSRMAELEETIQSMATSIDMISSMILRPPQMTMPRPSMVPVPPMASIPKQSAETPITPAPSAPSVPSEPKKAFITEVPEVVSEPFRSEGRGDSAQDDGPSNLDTQIADELRELESN